MKKFLLASVSGMALAGAAYGADMTVPVLKAPPPPPASWAGFYIGGDLGAARHDAWFNNLDDAFCCGLGASLNTTKTGFTGGGFAGYNWQDRSFVYGLEADINWFDTKADELWGGAVNNFSNVQQSQDAPWVATFRARLGLDVESTLFYFTGGLAVGQVKNSLNDVCVRTAGGGCSIGIGGGVSVLIPTGGLIGGFSEDTTRVGFTVGAGFEHLFSSHWLLRGEFRYVDLGKSNVNCATALPASSTACSTGVGRPSYRGEFSNSLMTGMFGLGYKF